MDEKIEPVKKSEYVYKISKEEGMKVPALIYASDELMKKIRQDNTLRQLRNVACMKGIIHHALVMPDAHEGYGFPIGGVAAFDMNEGVLSPGGIGYDINCGVRLLRTDWTFEDVEGRREELLETIFKEVPSGVGKGGATKLSQEELKNVLKKGAEWAVENGYGVKEDLQKTEENGKMEGADSRNVSSKAMDRGKPQLGTLGAGNHFLEIQKVGKIFNPEIARKFGIEKEGQITVMIHCGSRGLGHQIASDYIRMMENKYGTSHLPDRELVNAPINSELGQQYYSAMCCAVNYAFANRQMIMHWTRDAFKKVMGTSEGMDLVYDVCHNIAKFEEHNVNEEMKKICVHRKGATRSFGPGRKEIPDIYREVGQPVLIPGSMGTSSYLLVGTNEAEKVSWGSTAHGAGRLMSRHEALKKHRGEQVKSMMKSKGIIVKSSSWKGVAEEAPDVYKDIDEVVKVSDKLGIGNIVAKLIPIAVMKG